MHSAIKKAIDEMSYEKMLRLNRFEPIGSPWFQGEIGKYFWDVMGKKRSKLAYCDQVEISKKVGWDKPSAADQYVKAMRGDNKQNERIDKI